MTVSWLWLVAVMLTGDGGRWSFQSDEWSGRPAYRGTYPDGGRLEVWMRPEDRLVVQRPVVEQGFAIEHPDGGSQYFSVPAGTVLKQRDGGQVDFKQGGGHAHCWHASPRQHAVAYHRDEFCCHCAANRCVGLPWPDLCDGHGPRCPRTRADGGAP